MATVWWVRWYRIGSGHVTVCFASKAESRGRSICRCGCSSCLGTASAAGSPVSDCSTCGRICAHLWTLRNAFAMASRESQSASCIHGALSGNHQSAWITQWPPWSHPRPFLAGCCPPRISPPSVASLHRDPEPALPLPPQRIPAAMSHAGRCAAQRALHPGPRPGSPVQLQTPAVHCLSQSRAPAPLLFGRTQYLPQTGWDTAAPSQRVGTPPMWASWSRDPHTPANTPAKRVKTHYHSPTTRYKPTKISHFNPTHGLLGAMVWICTGTTGDTTQTVIWWRRQELRLQHWGMGDWLIFHNFWLNFTRQLPNRGAKGANPPPSGGYNH